MKILIPTGLLLAACVLVRVTARRRLGLGDTRARRWRTVRPSGHGTGRSMT